MMKNLYISTLILTALFCLLTTDAKCDHILVNGIRMDVVSTSPFGSYSGIAQLREQLKDYGTQCTEDNCQFDAEWKIINHQLLLEKIHSCYCNQKQQTADLTKLFKSGLKNGMLKADWFTGKIWLTNEMPFTWFCLVCPIWSRETCITVVNGTVTKISEVIYPQSPDPNKIKTIDSLTNLIYSHIHWDELRNLTQQTSHVRLGFNTDSLGRPFNIQTFNNKITVDSTWVIEAKKAIARLKWPLYFSQGIVRNPYWAIDLKLTKEQQDKFGINQH